jgi:hypothetical protein
MLHELVKMKKLLLFWIFQFSLWAVNGLGQEKIVSITDQGNNGFFISVFLGGSIYGPGTPIFKQMERSGFDDSSHNWFSSSIIDHPKRRNYPVYDFTLGMYFSTKKGISTSIGTCSNIEVDGYENIGMGNYLFLHNKLSFYSIDYLYRTLDRKHIFSIGLILLNYKIKDLGYENIFHTWESTKLPGIDLGYSNNLSFGKSFFIHLKTNLRLAPSTEIGPYKKAYAVTPNDISVFKATKVNLTSITVGLQFGIQAKTKGN